MSVVEEDYDLNARLMHMLARGRFTPTWPGACGLHDSFKVMVLERAHNVYMSRYVGYNTPCLLFELSITRTTIC